MVKRPKGLNSTAKAKRAKEDGSNGPNAEAQVTIEIEGDDPDNELAQLKGMYKAFTFEEDEETAVKLLHGVIHECDGMLRNCPQDKPLPASFHDVYALALLGMARFEDGNGEEEEEEPLNSNSKEFILAALDRADRGLEYEKDSWELLFTRAKINMALADELLSSADPLVRYSIGCDKVIPILDEAINDYENAERIVLAVHDNNKKYTSDQVDSIGMLLQIGDSLGALEMELNNGLYEKDDEDDDEDDVDDEDDDEDKNSGNDEENGHSIKSGNEIDDKKSSTTNLQKAQRRYLEWSKARWEQILTKVPQGKGKGVSPEDDGDHSYAIVRRANRGMGEYYLAMAGPLLNDLEAQSDDDDGDDDDEDDNNDDDNNDDDNSDDDNDNDGDKGNETTVLANKPTTKSEIDTLCQAKEYLETALQYLLKAEHEDTPSTYVLIAEAQISLANLYPVESDEQILLYSEAVSRLKRAQRLGHGNYQDLINDLQG